MGIDITDIVVAAIAFCGTLAGSFLSQKKSSALIAYRLEQLEKKVEDVSNLVALIYKLEQDFAVLSNRETVSEHRLTDLERKEG